MTKMRVAFAAMLLSAAGCGFMGKPDGSGTVECTEVQVPALVGGKIVALPAREGMAVKAGDVLARIDPSDYELRAAEVRAAATAAAADFERIRQVFERKSATRKQFDDAKAAADLARARLALAEKALADCVVTSPVAGTVTARVREEGEFAAPGATLVTVTDLRDAWLSIYVPERRLADIKVGQPARVKVDGRRDTFNGTVSFISPVAEFTPRNIQTAEERAKLVYRVKITLSNADGVFKPGMPADAYLQDR